MPLLFPIDPDPQAPIPGLSYVADYVDGAAELAIANAIDAQAWDMTWERRRQLFGAGYGPSSGNEQPIPGWGLRLIDRLCRDGISERPFDQMLVNEYLPGQGIALHL